MSRSPKTAPLTHRAQKPSRGPSQAWKLEDAKARFSEVVRRARDQGPQYVTVRGKPTVVVIDIDELEGWIHASRHQVPLVDFLESLDVAGLDLVREPDVGRDPPL